MKQNFLSEAEKYTRAQKRKKRRNVGVAVLACLVALGMVYALILPAITLENAEATPGHTHTAQCYTQVTTARKRVPICDPEGLFVHRHDEACYDESGKLWCPLPEMEAHTHTESCYAMPEAHIHTQACYSREQGEPVCGEHVHTDSCCRIESVLLCDQEEGEAHQHGESCYETRRETVCGVESEHQHTDACYAWNDVLTCQKPTDTEGEPVLACGREEVILHSHGAECFDEQGKLLCERPEVTAHQHTDACFETVEEPVDTGTLTCTLPEDENHTHNALCCGTWELTCGLTEEIPPQTEAEPPAETLPALTGDSLLVSQLRVEPMGEKTVGGDMLVRVGETARYRVSIEILSMTEEIFSEGRVKLEFLLPLTAGEAEFELDAMPWLDQTEGYAPVITEENRSIGETEASCLVLTAYRLLKPAEGAESGICGAFSEEMVIRVKQMEPGKTAAPQISAAMEYSAWDGICETHRIPEKCTVTAPYFTAACSAEEAQANYDRYLAELEGLEVLSEADGESLLERLTESCQNGDLTEQAYTELYERVFVRLYGNPETLAEQAIGTNWMALRDSGWFEAYSADASVSDRIVWNLDPVYMTAPTLLTGDGGAAPSDIQVDDRGGVQNGSDGVCVSKTIQGTDLENVFDITLQVQTSLDISEVISEPDVAVVIVLDISNTMNSNFGGVTRYAAAMNAAQIFLNAFEANNALGVSKVGFVAFNTNAHKIFDMQPCATAEQANALTDTMRTKTGNIINHYEKNDKGDVTDVARFTNIEAGLAMASDMLGTVSNQNKYIIFLSDGFPTTYTQSGYQGYNPYNDATTNYGTTRFYDQVLGKACKYGTSYSNLAAIKAREKAMAIKESGTTIFSIGVDIGGQTIEKYVTQSQNAPDFSVVDRTGSTYEIGDASTAASYKSWLGNRIGSGYYYDSTNAEGLTDAFNQIFETIKEQVIAGSKADWVASDPIPADSPVEFIGFYDRTPALVRGDLTGSFAVSGENTAIFDSEQKAIGWDLKHSGYQTATEGDTTFYTYRLTYRVRLCNEQARFQEGSIFPTNGSTLLHYRFLETVNGEIRVSDTKTVAFPVPSVHGYLLELTFQKVDRDDRPLSGAEFSLCHDAACGICRGDGTSVTLEPMTAVSDSDGKVTFSRIPSGHTYTLTETKVPDGFSTMGITYAVRAAYDRLTVTVHDPADSDAQWNGKITNFSYYALPDTGGAGTLPYAAGGALLATAALLLLPHHRSKRRKEDT